MKKSLVILTVMAVSLAYVGVALAGGVVPCPGPCEFINVPAKMGAPKPGPAAKVPLPGKIAAPKCVTPKCGPCITCPGGPYGVWEKTVMVPAMKKVEVFRNLCQGKTKGQCQLCGPCAPSINWMCKWQTKVICGEVEVPTMVPKRVKYEFPVVCKPKPCPPPECYF